MEKKINYKETLEKLFKGKKITSVVFIIGIIGIALIFLSTIIPSKDTSNITEEQISANTISSEEYTERLEIKLTELVEGMHGVGTAKVMVTLENGIEYVYANDQKKTNDTADNSTGTTDKGTLEEEIIIINGDNGEQAIVVTEIQPTVKGVVIVCDGGDNAAVKNDLINAVSTALNIGSNRISVIKSAG